MKSIQEYLEEASVIIEAKRPSKFKPQLFHVSNLFGAKNKVMYHDGALWHKRTNDEGRKEIAKWNGNPNNRAAWNPASIDGEYKDGKAVKWKEGYTFKDWLKTQKTPQNKDSKDPDSDDSVASDYKTTSSKAKSKNPLLTLDKAGADKAASEKIKRLIELLDALNESANVFRNAGILVERRLTAEEETELKQLIKDLEALTKNPNLSNMNLQMAKTQLGRAKDAASAMTFKNPQVKKKSQVTTPTDGDPGDSQASTDPQASADDVPAVDRFIKGDGSVDWDAAAEKLNGGKPLEFGTVSGVGVENPNYKEPEATGSDEKEKAPKSSRTPSGSLKAFIGSDEGGIKNNPEEVEAIKELQGILNDFGFNVGEPDGDYGKMTERGVKKFQAFVGLGRDGDAGPETIKELLALHDLRFSNDKTFGDFRRLMARMEKLIGKAGNAEESIDTSSMRGLIEAVKFLNEALSDADAKELQRVVDELADVYGDPSWQANLPRSTAKRFASNYKAAKGVLKDMGLKTPKASEEGKATEKNPEMSDKLDSKDELEKPEAPQTEVPPQPPETASGSDDTDYGEEPDTGPADDSASDSANADDTDDGEEPDTGPADDGNVEPRPTSQGGRMKRQDRWDRLYGDTHNPDGTPKDTSQGDAGSGTQGGEEGDLTQEPKSSQGPADDSASDSANADDPFGFDTGADDGDAGPADDSQGPADDVAAGVKSGSVAPMTVDDATKVVKQFGEFKDEILPQLSKEEQALFLEILGAANAENKPKARDTGIPADF